MLRKRLITVLTFNDGVLFRTKLFEPDYRYTHNFVDSWAIEEIVVLDVTRPGKGAREGFNRVIGDFARSCFVPLAAGGWIRTLDDVHDYLALGADKVVINTAAVERPEFITDVAQRYGSQCVVLSIDAKAQDGGNYEAFSSQGSQPTGLDPVEWAQAGVDLGAGEILLTAIDRDGSLRGYDLTLCRRVVDAVPVPVLILGGAGNWRHFAEGLGVAGAAAVCTQNIYHFTETSVRTAKKFLHEQGFSVRLG